MPYCLTKSILQHIPVNEVCCESESLVVVLEVLLTRRVLASLEIGIHTQKGITKKTQVRKEQKILTVVQRRFLLLTRSLHTRRALISLEIRPSTPGVHLSVVNLF